jgi:hypothetical protein
LLSLILHTDFFNIVPSLSWQLMLPDTSLGDIAIPPGFENKKREALAHQGDASPPEPIVIFFTIISYLERIQGVGCR